MIYDENTLKGQVKMDHTFSCRVSTCKTSGVLCCYWGPANGPKVGKERILTKISRNPTCILVLSVGILMFYVALRCQVRPWWSWKKVCEVAQFPLLLQWWRQPPMPGTSPCNWPFAGSDPFASLKFPCYWGQPRLTLQGEVSKGCKGHWSEGWNFNGFWIPTWCTWLSLV